MGRNIETKYWSLYQNNSGGFHIKNNDVAEYVIIEAIDETHVKSRAEKILKNYSGYCPCCGERWSDWDLREEKGTKEPTIDKVPVEEYESFIKNAQAIIHYIDGTKEVVNLKYKRW